MGMPDSPRVPVETVNFHLWQPCNMSCRFCFATFRDVRRTVLPEGHLERADAERVVAGLAEAGFTKLTFAGGEPLLCPWLANLVTLAHRLGMVTSVVTNGSLLDEAALARFHGVLDWITVSVDSPRPQTLQLLGRTTAGRAIGGDEYLALFRRIRELGFRLKMNTVVTAGNWREDMADFVIEARPERWKVFQALPVAGQNSGRVDPLLTTLEQFEDFVSRHLRVEPAGIRLIPEDNDVMTGSYAMVDPAGRFFDSVDSRGYTYSEPILRVGVHRAISQVRISRVKFLVRGGLYDFTPEPEPVAGLLAADESGRM
ncbi:radical S-adenosyl methionine domain-containing protein 2 [Thermomonospora echinospora]|uniref:S-adenosylmethionine-dependent nucleotide dehydratase n=1 Tax=Thermomonospora echinospora TaxID=1992 RepID=A0A1H6D571_9ACTN|nr:viperin family antiviral radical SAM protein [Thermomonospora echinospora]SEG80128.1 radical S-adenosyl methionine domain-containing protein 2 [Thermomonospora echinospora]